MATYQEYRELLVDLVKSINAQIPMEEENRVLLMYKLNTEEKIFQFNQWVKSRLDGEKLMATETEICRAAVQIAKKYSEATGESHPTKITPTRKVRTP